MLYVFFGLVWLAIVGFALSLGRAAARADHDMEYAEGHERVRQYLREVA